jgi:hypothetical protein
MESESGISFTEFTYQLLQGYDFVHLAREHGVRVQVRHEGLVENHVVGSTALTISPRLQRHHSHATDPCFLTCLTVPRVNCDHAVLVIDTQPAHQPTYSIIIIKLPYQALASTRSAPRPTGLSISCLCLQAGGSNQWGNITAGTDLIRKLIITGSAACCLFTVFGLLLLLQAGGSDQWGNITAGTDLIRKLMAAEGQEPPQCFGLTFPLLVRFAIFSTVCLVLFLTVCCCAAKVYVVLAYGHCMMICMSATMQPLNMNIQHRKYTCCCCCRPLRSTLRAESLASPLGAPSGCQRPSCHHTSSTSTSSRCAFEGAGGCGCGCVLGGGQLGM